MKVENIETHDTDEPVILDRYQRVIINRDKSLSWKIARSIMFLFACIALFPVIAIIFMFGLVEVGMNLTTSIMPIIVYVECWIIGFSILFMILFICRKKAVYLVFFALTFGILVVPRFFVSFRDFSAKDNITLMSVKIPTINQVTDPMHSTLSLKIRRLIHGHRSSQIFIFYDSTIPDEARNEYLNYLDNNNYSIRKVGSNYEASIYDQKNGAGVIIRISDDRVVYAAIKVPRGEFEEIKDLLVIEEMEYLYQY